MKNNGPVVDGRRVAVCGEDGVPEVAKDKDSVDIYVFDYGKPDNLLGSETISSSTWEAYGVTVDSSAYSSTSAEAVVSGTGGMLTNKVVTSGGRTLIRSIRFVGATD